MSSIYVGADDPSGRMQPPNTLQQQQIQQEAFQPQGSWNAPQSHPNHIYSQSPIHDKNSLARILHVIFKAIAVTLYIFSGFIWKSFTLPFVLITIFISFDFWVVKNISGRYLVGLRYWNKIGEDGSSDWVFEYKDPSQVHPADSNLFWVLSYANVAVWILFSLISLIRLNIGWVVLCIIAILIGVSNIGAYRKCNQYAKKQLRGGTMDNIPYLDSVKNFFYKGAIGSAFKNMF